MRNLFRRLSLFPIWILAGCAAYPPRDVSDSWGQTGLCAPSLASVTAALAGPGAIDCGTTLGQANLQAEVCVRSFSQSHRALRFGEAVFGPDAGDCEIVLRSGEGKLLHLRYFYDFSFQPAKHWLEVERCENLVVDRQVADPDRYFRLEGCVKDEVEVDRILAMHGQERR
jgi:hypothetical protein